MATTPTLIQPDPGSCSDLKGFSAVGWWSPTSLNLNGQLITIAGPLFNTPVLFVAGLNSFMMVCQAMAPVANVTASVLIYRPNETLLGEPFFNLNFAAPGTLSTVGAFSPNIPLSTGFVWWNVGFQISTDADTTITMCLFGGRR